MSAVAPESTSSEDALAGVLAAEMSGLTTTTAAPAKTSVETSEVEKPTQPIETQEESKDTETATEPPLDAHAALRAEIKAELLAELATQAKGPDVSILHAKLAKLEADRVAERVAADQAQLEQRIRTLKSLKLQAKQEGDEVSAERYADELDDAKREKQKREILATMPQSRQPSFEEQQQERTLSAIASWRTENKVFDEGEFSAAIAMDQALSLKGEPNGPKRWTMALEKVRGVTKGAARPKAAYAPSVEGTGARPAASKSKPVRSEAEKKAIAALVRHGGLKPEDF